jgi:hypothetical protein
VFHPRLFSRRKIAWRKTKKLQKKNIAEAHDIELFIAFKKILLYTFFDFVRIFFHHAPLHGFCGETNNGARLARVPGIQGSALNPEERRK